jgi:oligoribonuclease
MHTTSGLITEIPNGVCQPSRRCNYWLTLKQRELLLVNHHWLEIQLALIAISLPEICRALASTCITEPLMFHPIKELARRWYPKLISPPQPRPATIARLGDIQDSIAELAYYRTTLFIPSVTQESNE